MRRMTISLLHQLAGEQLPFRVEGSEDVDSVQILALAGHVIVEVAAPVRTPLGWGSQSAIVRGITHSGRRMVRVSSPFPGVVSRNHSFRPCGPLVIGLVTASFAAAGVGLEVLLRIVG